MEKSAETHSPSHDSIARRWSPRAFAARPVEPEKLRSIFEAARWAPSSANEQPWSFIVATKENPEEFAKAFACLVEGNQKWAKDAPLIGFAIAHSNWNKNGQPNGLALYDLGEAMAHVTAQATFEGLFVHQMGGILPEKVAETYGLPSDYRAITGFVIGYGGDPSSLPDDLRERELAPRQRKPIDSFVFAAQWNAPAPFTKR
jgi:nitroreductase